MPVAGPLEGLTSETPKPRSPEVIAAARTTRQSLPFGQLGVTPLAEPPLLS
jgi:hypothetical protein